MSHTSNTPSIDVTIGRQTRLYHAFITTAPSTLDPPSTLTLYDGPLSDILGFAVDPRAIAGRRHTPSRLILTDAVELAWQRTRCARHAHGLAATDPGVLNPTTLQQWLWNRLQSPAPRSIDAYDTDAGPLEAKAEQR